MYCLYMIAIMFMFFVIALLAGSGPAIMKSKMSNDLNGLVEFTGALTVTSCSTLSICMFECMAEYRCVSFFYNKLTMKCLLHSKHFYSSFVPPSESGNGWQYYKIIDVSGGCPEDAVLYRSSNFCYTVSDGMQINFEYIKTDCTNQNGQHAPVRTEQMQIYFSHFLAGRFINNVCIAGEAQADDSWKLDDGTTLTFFQWYPNQPHPSAHIDSPCIVFKDKKFREDKWFDSSCSESINCTYVCEIPY